MFQISPKVVLTRLKEVQKKDADLEDDRFLLGGQVVIAGTVEDGPMNTGFVPLPDMSEMLSEMQSLLETFFSKGVCDSDISNFLRGYNLDVMDFAALHN